MLPAHLFTRPPMNGQIVWPILPAAGITLAILIWLLGGLGAQRVPLSVVTILLLFVLFHDLLAPRLVLRPDRLFVGDLLNSDPTPEELSDQNPWFNRTPPTGYDSLRRQPAGDRLLAYTSSQQRPERASLTMEMLIRDRMPPLENLIIGGQAATIGTGSAIAVIAGGLFLLYRGLIDFRIPLLGTLSAMAAMLTLPVPIYITEAGAHWRWFAFRAHFLGWPTALTFVNYEIFASPLLFTLFYLATAPGLRPITRRGLRDLRHLPRRSLGRISTLRLGRDRTVHRAVGNGPTDANARPRNPTTNTGVKTLQQYERAGGPAGLRHPEVWADAHPQFDESFSPHLPYPTIKWESR